MRLADELVLLSVVAVFLATGCSRKGEIPACQQAYTQRGTWEAVKDLVEEFRATVQLVMEHENVILLKEADILNRTENLRGIEEWVCRAQELYGRPVPTQTEKQPDSEDIESAVLEEFEKDAGPLETDQPSSITPSIGRSGRKTHLQRDPNGRLVMTVTPPSEIRKLDEDESKGSIRVVRRPDGSTFVYRIPKTEPSEIDNPDGDDNKGSLRVGRRPDGSTFVYRVGKTDTACAPEQFAKLEGRGLSEKQIEDVCRSERP